MSKQQFTAEYAAAVRAFWNRPAFTETLAVGIIDGVIAGRFAPTTLLKLLAEQHGAKPGRVGNFLRGVAMSELETAEMRMEFAKEALDDAALAASCAVEHEQEYLRQYRVACLVVEQLLPNYEI